ncbi:MAG: TlpA disulfide reductase family protein [Deltaproteobacteria bacterium]
MRAAPLLLLLAACATAPKVAPKAEALDFTLPDTTGKSVSTKDFAGKVVLVDFWATWCKPCEASFPFYDAIAKKYGERGFEILAVSVDEEDADVAAFLEAKPVSFTVLRDPAGSIPERLNLQTMPTAVLLGRDGSVKHVHEGFFDEDREAITKLVEAELGAE